MLGLIVPTMMTNPDLACLFLALTGRERGGSETQAVGLLISSNETCYDSSPTQEKESTSSACPKGKTLAQETSWKLQSM